MGIAALMKEKKSRKLLLSAGLSWLFDAMDVGMVSFVVAALAVEWGLSAHQIGLISAINAIGMAAGAACAGILADKYGRANVLILTLLIFSAASGLSALAGSFAVLCILRFVTGFGLGGELPVASTLVSESVPAKDRGRAVVLLESFWALGWIVAALIAYFVIPDYGWRAAFVIGAAPALYALYLRKAIKDPPTFERARSAKLTIRQRVAAVWSAEYKTSTLMLWILWFMVVFSYYGMFLWLPTLMLKKGFTLVKSFEYVLVITLAQLPGYFTAAYFIERFGRKFVLVFYLLMTAVSAIWFALSDSPGMIITAGMSLSFFNLGAWGGMYAYTPELYKSEVRSTGVGLAASFGRIGGVIGPYLVGALIEGGVSILSIFIIFFGAILLGAAAVLFLGKETKGLDPDAA
ncbi:MFS transporter [Paenibacillus methanolicus]|uniref:Putative MFS transporter n=1 Tax=Paenibacillus methanolicus TaxID=582686 RepID=A0A5S5CLS5_9BACL|nr:MFS transporter [Paenibacillus methanolicus]TYP79461.1 putative MFS transporter [Paenibacillus methanolicus]